MGHGSITDLSSRLFFVTTGQHCHLDIGFDHSLLRCRQSHALHPTVELVKVVTLEVLVESMSQLVDPLCEQ